MIERNPEVAVAAQLQRRTSLRVDIDQINELAALPRDEAINRVLNAPPDGEKVPDYDKSDDLLLWWTKKITAPGSGIHERMTFLWHTILTSHRYSSGDQILISRQLNMLRSHAQGNFRQLLQDFMIDGALIHYLDANSSTAKKPNENLSRELMELFSTGLGNYNEDDVRAAALAMAGWKVDKDKNFAVELDTERTHKGEVTFLGKKKKWDVPSIVDRLCDHPATAARIASKVWFHFIGQQLDGAKKKELGTWWQNQDLEIKPLVERVVSDPAMTSNHYSRPRSGFEFYAALATIHNLDPTKAWQSRSLGQALYEPPNVAGWPDDRWLTPDSLLRRSHLLFSIDYKKVSEALTATPDQILDRCGLYQANQATIDAVTTSGAGAKYGDEGISQLRWRIALSSPEFQLT